MYFKNHKIHENKPLKTLGYSYAKCKLIKNAPVVACFMCQECELHIVIKEFVKTLFIYQFCCQTQFTKFHHHQPFLLLLATIKLN